MFSGIVEELGEVVEFDGERLEIRATEVLEGLEVSESINVSGACLTVIESLEGGFVVEVVPETVLRTNFNELTAGGKVNLERSLRFGGRVGGHIVQGHVDGLAAIVSIDDDGNSIRIWLKPPQSIMKYIVEKGFISLDGISLTVVDVTVAEEVEAVVVLVAWAHPVERVVTPVEALRVIGQATPTTAAAAAPTTQAPTNPPRWAVVATAA